jgi:hypothetical protein
MALSLHGYCTYSGGFGVLFRTLAADYGPSMVNYGPSMVKRTRNSAVSKEL